MLGDRLIWDKRTNPPTALLGSDGKGRYNIVVPGSTNAAIEPAGDAYQLATLKKDGMIGSSGRGADFLKPAIKSVPAGISKNGAWPFFAPAYPYFRTSGNTSVKKTEGEVIGWLALTNDTVTGDLICIKTFWTNRLYAGGFTNMKTVIASSYIKPVGGDPIFPATNGALTIAGGNVPAPMTNSWTLYGVNTLVATNGSAEDVHLRIAIGKGEVTVWNFRNPATPQKVTKGKAVVLQTLNEIRGVFLGTNQSGSLLLTP
jgi:hypothetical protein